MSESKKSNGKKKFRPSDLARVYFNPRSPGGYGGVARLQRETKAPIKAVKQWLRSQDAYALHKSSRKRLKSDQIVVSGVDHMWCSDLMDCQKLSSDNDGYNYIMVVVDALSKFGWVKPLINKEGQNVSDGLRDIVRTSHRSPRMFRTDRGVEYTNNKMQRTLSELGIRHIIADHRTKEAIAERFIRTIKDRIWRYFTATNSTRYIDVLQDLLHSYNHTVHRTIRRRPVDVTIKNGEDIWRQLYGHLLSKKIGNLPDLKVGDVVLISKDKNIFAKGYTRRWVIERFKISDIKGGHAGVFRYKLKDLEGDEVLSTFKREELQRIIPKERIVQRVLKSRNGRTKVTWRGYPTHLETYLEE